MAATDLNILRLRQCLKGEVRHAEPLANHTTWRIGGPAQLFVVPEGLDDLRTVVALVAAEHLPLFVLGRGSNLLIDDDGLPGVTLCMTKCLRDVQITSSGIRAGGSVPLPTLAKLASEQGYTGYEFLIGIPGTVGAGVIINAGAGGYQIADILDTVTFLDRYGELHTIAADDLKLQYRSSSLAHQPVIIVEATFRLDHKDDPKVIEHRLREFIEKRRQKFPLNLPNAGSVFKRPENGTGPHAGWLSETAGMKGFRIGDAQVSELHANFIVNLGEATAKDVRAVIEEIYQRVLSVHNIALEREVIFWPEEGCWLPV